MAQLLLHPTGSNRVRTKQLDAWEAKVALVLERRRKALAIVLEFKADVHAHREARVAMVMRQLADPAFPRELLLNIIETATGSRSLYWRPSEDHTLDMIADSFFLWPFGVESDTQIVLRQTVADVLRKAFLTRLFLRVTTEGALMIPLSLNGNSAHIRRLVVGLSHISLTYGGHTYSSASKIHGMELLGLSFPRLEVCVCLLQLGNLWSLLSGLPRADVGAIKENLAVIVAAFLRSGPGRRKLVHCGDASPLVEYGHHEAPGDNNARLDAGGLGDGDDLLVLSAERIVEQAYTLHRRSAS